jgi:hypothetical protein
MRHSISRNRIKTSQTVQLRYSLAEILQHMMCKLRVQQPDAKPNHVGETLKNISGGSASSNRVYADATSDKHSTDRGCKNY